MLTNAWYIWYLLFEQIVNKKWWKTDYDFSRILRNAFIFINS